MLKLIGLAFAIAFIGLLLWALYLIIRFSVISPLLTRGTQQRLRQPDPQGIEELVGFAPGPDLLDFYRTWPHLDKLEYYLVDEARQSNWFIGGFLPLSRIDISEWLKTSGKHGLPIADNLDKGTYYVQPDGSIELRSPNVANGRVKVAGSIAELGRFRVAEPEEIDPDEDE